jgi:putative transposase
MEMKYSLCINAVKRYLSGDKPSSIYKPIGKSKQWLWYWVNRYDPHNPKWYKNRSNSSKPIYNKIDSGIEQLICNIRKRLENTKYSQVGPLTIQWELKKLGVQQIPHTRTISRVLKRNDLVKEPKKYEKRNKLYPEIKPRGPNILHQLDLVGPRYLGKGKQNKFYSFHLIDAYSNAVKIKPYLGKRDVFVKDLLVYSWQTLGIPWYVQFDNELSFRGSNRYPRTFGEVIKLCLYVGVEPIFVPESEPWRQGIIERFNDVYDKTFFRSQFFENFEHLREESAVFEQFHNQNHRYNKLSGRTPWVVHTTVSRRLIPKSDHLQEKAIPFTDGKVSFVRLTDHRGCARFFTETFEVDKDLPYQYVKGTIDTKANLLKFHYDNRIIKAYGYKVNKR